MAAALVGLEDADEVAGLRVMELDVQRTEGVSGAFIKELLRKAALFAADAGSPAVLETHLTTALHES